MPRRPLPGAGQHKLKRLPPGVHEDEEVVIEQRRAVSGTVGIIGSVQVESERQGARVRPVAIRHLRASGGEPAQFRRFGSGEETAAAEHRVLLAEGDEPAGEVLQLSVGLGPVDPGDLVVLAVSVVVALLSSAELVAAQHHRDAERQQQGRQHCPGLARPQREDGRVSGRALGPAVPRAVVAGPVPVRFPVGLVVLAVIRNEVPERKAVMDRDQVHRGCGPAVLAGVEIR